MGVEPRAFLADFGLAKSVATGSKLTRTGEALGTPAYMSPEQARGEVSTLTPATDVWSLGCVLHEMIAGRSPFEADSAAAVIGRVFMAEPTPLHRDRSEVPRAVASVVASCLVKETGRRTSSVAMLRDDLDRVLAGLRPRGGSRAVRRRLAAASVLVASALGIAALRAGESPPSGTPAVPAAGAASEPPGDVLVRRALASRTTEPRRAAELLEAALVEAPGRADVRVELGLIRWALGESGAARASWALVPDTAPEGSRARVYELLEQLVEGARAEVVGPMAERLEGAPGRLGSLASGVVEIACKDWPAARRALADVPGWEAALLRGYVEGGGDPAGDLATAVREYSAALAVGPPIASVHANRSVARRRAGDLAGSLEDADAAICLRPGHPVALAGRARTLRDLRRLPEALEACDDALQARPDDPGALRLRASVRADLGDLPDALRDYDASLRARPDDAETLYDRGTARAASGDLRGALDDFTRALDLRPDDPEAYVNRAVVRGMLGDPAGAERDLTAAIRLRPGYATAHANRGTARMALGDVEGGLADFRAAARLDPGSASAQGNLGEALRLRGEFDEAARTFRRALEIAPGNGSAPEWRRRLAECESNR